MKIDTYATDYLHCVHLRILDAHSIEVCNCTLVYRLGTFQPTYTHVLHVAIIHAKLCFFAATLTKTESSWHFYVYYRNIGRDDWWKDGYEKC